MRYHLEGSVRIVIYHLQSPSSYLASTVELFCSVATPSLISYWNVARSFPADRQANLFEL